MRREDVWLFIVSVLVSIGIFIQVDPLSAQDRERELTVPLELRGLSAVLNAEAPNTVRVIANGTTNELNQLNAGAIKAFINLDNARAGTANYNVMIAVPAGANVRIVPVNSKVKVTLAPKLQKVVTVFLETTGVLQGDYVYGGASYTPETVTVIGSQEFVDKVVSVRALLNLSEVGPKSPITVDLDALDSEGKPVPNITIEPEQVSVSPALDSAPAGKRVTVTVVPSGRLPFGYEVVSYTIQPEFVVVTGSADVLAKFITLSTEPIDISQFKESTQVSARLVLPEGVRASVESVTVNLDVRQIQQTGNQDNNTNGQ